MRSRRRRSFTAEMKARVALEAIKGQKTVQEIASHYGVHPNQVTNWKRQAILIAANAILDPSGETTAGPLSKLKALS